MTAARTDGPDTDRQPRWLDDEESRTWIAWVLSTPLRLRPVWLIPVGIKFLPRVVVESHEWRLVSLILCGALVYNEAQTRRCSRSFNNSVPG